MPRTERLIWPADPGAPGGRRARESFSYDVFHPDPVATLRSSYAAEMAAILGEAEATLARFDSAVTLVPFDAMARLLLRAESISSSRIEGLAVGNRRLALALFDEADDDETARAIVRNILAMEQAIAIGRSAVQITPRDIQTLHATLMQGIASYRDPPGAFRTAQNWIGGRLPVPRDAEYIPPPPDAVPDLIRDLAAFCNRDDLPAIAQAAIAHAQFETIHPFIDGNGRVGRCLIHLILLRRGSVERHVPPVSNVLAAEGRAYIGGLVNFREGNTDAWLSTFASAISTAATRSHELLLATKAMQEQWRHALKPRGKSTADRLIEVLPAIPVVDASRVAHELGVSETAARHALAAMEQAGILRPLRGRLRDRAWSAPQVFGLLDGFEWTLTESGPDRRRSPRPTRQSDELLRAQRPGRHTR